MIKRSDLNRSHRIVGWLSAIALWVFLGLPALIVVSMGECLLGTNIHHAECLTDQRLRFFITLLGAPLLAAAIGWFIYRWSKFLV